MTRPSGGSLRLPKAVLFDMDDTIVDHALTCRDALACLRRDAPSLRRRSLDALWTEYSRLLEEVHPDVVSGVLAPEKARIERFRRLATFSGVEVSSEEAQAWSTAYRTHYQSRRRLVPGARRLLERLHRRAVVGVVTNSRVVEQDEKVARFGLSGLLDFLLVSESVGVSKPDPEIFAMALDRASAEPGETVMIGDSWERDVLGARRAGIAAIWFNRFERSPPSSDPVPQLTSFRAPRRVEALLSSTVAP